nr:amiloride sensitive amine oxidase [Hymenolepis microstoma]
MMPSISILHSLILLVLTLEATCQRYHIADVGPYDELSAEEINNVYINLGSYLGRQFIPTHYFLSKNATTNSTSTDSRVVHIALEVPAKENRNEALFLRFARVALYTPGEPHVTEYIVGTSRNNVNVTEVRRVPSIKRPVDEVESDNLQAFLLEKCSEDFDGFLQRYYGASLYCMNSSKPCSTGCMEDANATENPASYPACLFGMFASPRVTLKKPGRRITIFRLNRLIPPYNQHPIDVHIAVDHTETDSSLWQVDGVSIQGRQFASLNESLNFTAANPQLIRMSTSPSVQLKSFHTVQMGPDLCPRTQASELRSDYRDIFNGSIVNKHVVYGPWSFHLGVRHETGLRIYDVKFDGELIMNEAGMEETVTVYGGDTPFMRSMTSLESMYGVGSLTSELSPGIDCPEDAIYLSVPIILTPKSGTKTVHNGICIFDSSANVHGGAIRRHYQEFADENKSPNYGYGTGKTGKSLYVVTIASIFNYQYSFVNIFSPTGSYACYVVPSGYIHMDNPRSSEHNYGFLKPQFNLTFNIHTHHFLFFVDALGSNNTVEQIKVYAENERDGFDMMNMQVWHLRNESEGRIKGGDSLTRTAICISGESVPHRCLNVLNVASMPSLVTKNASRSFPWIRKSLWFTKYKTEELRASSIYNGVDLTDPVVDFATFSDNESLEGDVVMWINVGFLHIPVNEDVPLTPSKNSQIGFILTPSNFFPQGPDSMAKRGLVFTANKNQWINGYVHPSHPECDRNSSDTTPSH